MDLNRAAALELADKMGIEYKKTVKTNDLITMINQVTGEEYGYDNGKGETTKIVDKKVVHKDTVLCMIHSNDRDNEETEVVGSLNGETFQAMIGEEFEFPKKFIPAIKDAVMEIQTAILNDAGEPTGKYRERRQPRYVIERI